MKIGIITDDQVSGRTLAAYRKQTEALLNACVARRVRAIKHAGDLFERPNIGDQIASTGAIAEAVIQWMREAGDEGIHIDIISGNHDMAGAGSRDALTVIEALENVTVWREPGVDWASGGISTLYLPWAWASEETPDAAIDRCAYELRPDPIDILLGHVEVVGAVMQAGRTCEPSPGKWQVSRQYLQELVDNRHVRHIALGHFHQRQDLFGGHGGYVGALMQHGFGEEGNPAGFEIFDTETGEVEWVELDGAPRYVTYHASVSNPPPAEAARDGEIVRVRFDSQPAADEIRRMESKGVRVEIEVAPVERIQRAAIPEGAAHDPRELIQVWAQAQHPPLEPERIEAMLAAHDRLHADDTAEAHHATA